MANHKYSVLLMRDDDHVRRFRMESSWLRLALYFVIFLMLIAAGGVYSGYAFWEKKEALEVERQRLLKQLHEANVETERVRNERSFNATLRPEEQKTLLESLHRRKDDKAPVDLNKLFQTIDQNKLKISNLNFKATDAKGFRLSFDLANDDVTKPLSGQIELVFVMRDGQGLDIELDKEILSFQIQRYKTFVANFQLPDGASLDTVYGLRLSVSSTAGKVLYSQVFPISKIMS